MKITIKNVAEHAGVSKTSVSFFINGKRNLLSEKTQKRISLAIKELNYTPNRIARNLSNQKSGFIALLIPDLTNPFYSILAQSILENIRIKESELVILRFPHNKQERENVLELLNSNTFDGALIVSSKFDEIINQIYDQKLIEFILLDERIDDNNLCMVTGDSEYGGYIAGEYLIKKGHRNVACIAGPKMTPNSNNRLNGIDKKFKEIGIDIRENVVYGDYTFQGGYEAIKSIELNKISAIFCFNDLMAFGAIKCIEEKGYQVPEDISIIGYDNLPMNKYMNPLLTTIDQHIDEIGKKAIEKLMNIIGKGDNGAERSVFIKPTLIEGETVKDIN